MPKGHKVTKKTRNPCPRRRGAAVCWEDNCPVMRQAPAAKVAQETLEDDAFLETRYLNLKGELCSKRRKERVRGTELDR